MKMLIDKIKLRLLLEKKRDYIRHTVDGIDILIAAIVYVVSLMCSDFKSAFGIDEKIIETLAWVFAVVILIYGLYRMVKSFCHRYNHELLYKDIENLDEVLHKFSVIGIKDYYNEFANRFLLYYDDAWKCWFFFSFHTSEVQNEENIIQRLSHKLKINPKYIKVQYISDRIQPKFSEKDKINKVYQHSLYQGIIAQFPENMKQDEFEIDGIRYRWWTIEEMEAEPRIMEVNSDVVSYVKEKIR